MSAFWKENFFLVNKEEKPVIVSAKSIYSLSTNKENIHEESCAKFKSLEIIFILLYNNFGFSVCELFWIFFKNEIKHSMTYLLKAIKRYLNRRN